MFNKLYQLSSFSVGIDLGTANTLVYVKDHGIVINEPSIIALNEKTGRLVAIGNDAKQMVGRTPGHIKIIRPLVDGVISNFEVTEEMLAYFFRRVSQLTPRKLFRPEVVIGVPSGITNVEIRAVRDATKNAGARVVHIIEEPIAASIGIKLPIHDPIGNMIVDIGGGTTDVAVISLGSIVQSKNVRVAGDKLNQDIISYVRDEFKILLGEKTAEEVKIAIGSVQSSNESQEMIIRGRDLVTGLPKEVVITDSDIKEAIGKSMAILIIAIKEVLEMTPPEVIADIMQKGIVVVGGGSLLKGMKDMLEYELKIPIHLADDPLTAVVRGTGMVVENLPFYQSVLLPNEDDLYIA